MQRDGPIQFVNSTQGKSLGPVCFLVKDPVYLTTGIGDSLISSGCSVIDMVFPVPTTVQEVYFRNYYTANISVMILTRSHEAQESGDGDDSMESVDSVETLTSGSGSNHYIVPTWKVSIARRQLMPYPHLEVGAEEEFKLTAEDSACSWKDLFILRLVLRQPSPCWSTFTVKNIYVSQIQDTRLPWMQRHKHAINDPICRDFYPRLMISQNNTIRALTNRARSATRSMLYEINMPLLKSSSGSRLGFSNSNN